MNFNGEQIVFDNVAERDINLLQETISRYNWALPYICKKKVADLGCGTGLGTFLLSLIAEEVVGYDQSQEAIDYAYEKLGQYWPICFFKMDLEKQYPKEEFDVAVTFENIEHLVNPDFIMKNLNYKVMVGSIPIDSGVNEFHKVRYSEKEAWNFLNKYLKITNKGEMVRPDGRKSILFVGEKL